MLRLWASLSRYEKVLIFLFVLTIPFIHAQVRGDGIGYYAYARSLLIDHDLQFAGDWKNPSVQLMHVLLDGRMLSNPVTKTGHLPNHWSIGPAMLWSPFLVTAHLAVLGLNRLGWQIPADGRSWPYMIAMAGATALYAVVGILLSFRLARNYANERWAFLATLGIWLGTSLPIYIYVDPSWSHALSVFCASLFLWYWLQTRPSRTKRQWIVLGLISGLMIDVHFTNVVFLLALFPELLREYNESWRKWQDAPQLARTLLYSNLLYATALFVAFLPTLITRQIVFGSPFRFGMYTSQPWNWTSPAFLGVLFSLNHGLLVYTPILLPAFIGIVLLARSGHGEGLSYVAVTLALYCMVAFFPWWDSTVGLGNRYFVALTPLFIIGLAFTFSRAVRLWRDARAATWRLGTITVLVLLWNLGLVYQWSTNLMAIRTQVYWDEVLYNQFRIVPGQLLQDLAKRFLPQRNTGA
jgi:Dolichyl-phosphate-mannose-protein mannosyltransferase